MLSTEAPLYRMIGRRSRDPQWAPPASGALVIRSFVQDDPNPLRAGSLDIKHLGSRTGQFDPVTGLQDATRQCDQGARECVGLLRIERQSQSIFDHIEGMRAYGAWLGE